MRNVGIIMMLLLPLMLKAGVPDYAPENQKWDKESVESLFDGRQLAAIEGVWRFPGNGATIAIVQAMPETYNIYIIDSPLLDVRPGTQIGDAIETVVRDTYEGSLKSKGLGLRHKLKSQSVVFEATKDGRLIIKPYKTGYSLSLKRWFTHLFRIGIEDNTNKRPNNLDGARRIYPVKLTDHLPIVL